jgi:tetratricopeptide (TPR) repeat protein
MNLFRRKKPTEIVQNKVEVDPDKLDATTMEEYLRRGLLFHARGDEEKAVADLRKVLGINPDSVDAHYNLGLILKEMGKMGEARDEFKAAVDKLVVLEEEDSVRALMIGKLARWQIKHLEPAG